MGSRGGRARRPRRAEHPGQPLQKLPLGRTPVRRLSQHHCEAPPEQGIPHRLRGELEREGNEPSRLPRAGAGPGHGRELLEQGEYERSEEHTSELQSLAYLVCRLLLEKKKKNRDNV